MVPQSMQFIDSSIIRAHQHAVGGKGGADNAIGRSRGGLTTKIHAIVDENGLPVKLLLTPGHASDKATAQSLLEGLPSAKAFVGDRAYDWQHLIDLSTFGTAKPRFPLNGIVKSSSQSTRRSIVNEI